jgi:hypothetical protein
MHFTLSPNCRILTRLAATVLLKLPGLQCGAAELHIG